MVYVSSLRSVAVRWPAVLAVVVFVSGIALAGLQYQMVRGSQVRDSDALAEAHARDWLRHAEFDASGVPVGVRRVATSAEMALGLGLRVLDPAGEVVVSRGTLADRLVAGHGGVTKRIEGPVRFAAPGGDGLPLRGFQLERPGGGWVQVAVAPSVHGGAPYEQLVRSVVTFGSQAVLVVAFAAWLIGRGLRPLRAIMERTRRLSATRRLEHVATSASGDEIDELGLSFNAMMDRLGVGVERMQRFSANVAHELRAPMSRVRNRTENRLADGEDLSESDRGMLERTLADVDRLNATVRAMLQLAHSDVAVADMGFRSVSLGHVLEGVVDFFAPLAEDALVEVELEPHEEVFVAGDSNLLHELFGNLVDNAIKFGPENSRVRVGVTTVGEEVLAFVEDEGPGVNVYQRDRIFQAFHRLDKSVPGSGLGLALAREIAHAHRGSVHVESPHGKGANFVVTLPLVGAT